LNTYSDLLDSIARIVYGHGLSAAADQVRMAASMALDQLPTMAPWNRYKILSRVHINGVVTGKAEWTDGELVRDGGDWPNWCGNCTIVINGWRCQIRAVGGDTATLSVTPPAHVSGEVSYVLYHDYAKLPDDFIVMDGLHSFDPPLQLEPSDRCEVYRQYGPQLPGAMPNRFAIESEAEGHAIRLYPPPGQRLVLDVMYRRKVVKPVHSGRDAVNTRGTISTDGTSVTGTGTTFRQDMVGRVLRIGDEYAVPTGLDGLAPYADEAVIVSVASPTSLTLSKSVAKYTDVRYCITDILDIDDHMFYLVMALSMQALSQILGKQIEIDVKAAIRDAQAADARQAGPYGGRDTGGVRTMYLTARIGGT